MAGSTLEYLKKKRLHGGKRKGWSPNWQAVRELLQAGPMTPQEIGKNLGWGTNKTWLILNRMKSAGEIEKRLEWRMKKN